MRLQPYGRVPAEEAFDAYREQASALATAGVDLLVIETQTDVRELEQAVAAARDAAPGVALLASATFTRDDRTLLGDTPEAVAGRLVELGVDAFGVNCGEGPAQALRIARLLAPIAGAAGVPLLARPNAGGPTEVGGRFVYPATPEYVAEVGPRPARRGCVRRGRMLRHRPGPYRGDRERAPRSATSGTDRVPVTGAARGGARARPASPPTALEAAIGAGELVITVEMEPPRSFNAAQLVAAAQTLRDAGADCDRRRGLADGQDADERLGGLPTRCTSGSGSRPCCISRREAATCCGSKATCSARTRSASGTSSCASAIRSRSATTRTGPTTST